MESNLIIREDINTILSNDLNWKSFEGKTILITGANGFLASYLVKTILSLNKKIETPARIIALVRNLEKAKSRFKDYLDFQELTIISDSLNQKLVLKNDIHFIIHAASQASPKYYGIDPVGTIEANVLGTYNLLQLAREKEVESFLYFSSGEVYGILPEEKIPMREMDYGYVDPTHVRSCYAEGKRMGENLCVSFHHQYQIPIKIVRPFHTYGPGMDLEDGRVFADFVADIVHKKNIKINGDGKAIRPFCYIADASFGFFKILLEGQNGEAYNLGNPNQEYSIKDLAYILVKIKPEFNLSVEMNEKHEHSNQYLQSPIKRNSPNIDKIKTIGWLPTTNVVDGFRNTIDSYL